MAAVLAAALGFGAGCGSGLTPPGKVSINLRFATPAEQLAVVDEGGVVVDRAKLRRYQVLLERLDDRCRESQLRIAEIVAETLVELGGYGAQSTALQLLEQASEAGSVNRVQRCDDVFAALASRPR